MNWTTAFRQPWKPTESMVKVPMGVALMWFPHLGQSLPPNYRECNGQVVDEPRSPMYGLTLPNLNDDKYGVGSTGQSGQVVGSNSVTLQTAHLPPANITGTIGSASAGTPSGNVTVSTGGAHTHSVTDPGHSHATKGYASGLIVGINGLAMNASASSTVASNSATTGISVSSGGAHDHAASFTGTAMGNHTHSVSLSLNSGQQQAVPTKPSSITCRYVMRIL